VDWEEERRWGFVKESRLSPRSWPTTFKPDLAAVNQERAEDERLTLKTTPVSHPKGPNALMGPAAVSQAPKTNSETSKAGGDDALSSHQ
jgi:hypothetical protein